MNNEIKNWLLEEENPSVRMRALRELNGTGSDAAMIDEAKHRVLATLDAATDMTWADQKGLTVLYKLLTLAESGLTRHDINIDNIVYRLLEVSFDAGCGDFMLLRALVMLGYGEDPALLPHIDAMGNTQLSDGGWLCLHRLEKLRREPKSCIKAAMHALLLAAEMKRSGLALGVACENALCGYFLRRRLFYRMDDANRLVLDCEPGKRMTNIFFPAEAMRVGLPMLLYGLCVLGLSNAPELNEAWALLRDKTDVHGKVLLEGTMARPYLPREHINKPSKWATLYAGLALQYK